MFDESECLLADVGGSVGLVELVQESRDLAADQSVARANERLIEHMNY